MCDETKSKLKNSINSIWWYGHVVRKYCLVVFTAAQFPCVILCPNLMTVKTNKRKVLNTCKELIRKTMAFEYEELLLLKSPQNKVAPNIVITGKKKRKTSQTYHVC